MANNNMLPSDALVRQTMDALRARNIMPYLVADRAAALAKIKELIPAGASVMTGASVTLEQIGLVDWLKSGQHGWNNLKAAIVAEADPIKQAELRRQSILADYWLGSVHAVAATGEVIAVSNTGSQLPAYAFSSPNLIWVVGAQKLVPTLLDGMKRVREYVVPLEDQHMKSLGYPGTNLSKWFIFEKETMPSRHLHLILVNEVLGF